MKMTGMTASSASFSAVNWDASLVKTKANVRASPCGEHHATHSGKA